MGFLDGLDPSPAHVRPGVLDEDLQHCPVAVTLQLLTLVPEPLRVVLDSVTGPLTRHIGQLMFRQALHPGAHGVTKLGRWQFLVRTWCVGTSN